MQNYGNILKKLQKLQNYEIKTSKQKWNAIKQETGQNKYISPTLIIEGKVHQTQPKKMADALNRMHLKSVRETINSIPNTQTNPLKSYYKYLGQDEQSKLSFTFKQISMADLSSIITSMVPTGSTSRDEISMWLVKQARVELEPQLLHLTSKIIETGGYPEALNTTKAIHIEKPNQNTQEGWRMINLVSTLSKIVEKSLMKQITNHLKINGLISHVHHGAVGQKSTQTLKYIIKKN